MDCLEQEYGGYCNVKNCMEVGNNLDANHLALLALIVGAGGEVIVLSNTYIVIWLGVK